MRSFTTSLSVEQPLQKVFDAIMNVRGWWQGEIEGSTSTPGEEFIYRMGEIHFSKQKTIELIPNETVSWLVTESKLSFTGSPDEWTGTTIRFEVFRVENKTEIRFTHEGLVPELECFSNCSNAWGLLVQESLSSLIRTGKGTNVFG